MSWANVWKSREILNFGWFWMLFSEHTIDSRLMFAYFRRDIYSLQTDFVYILLIFLFRKTTTRKHSQTCRYTQKPVCADMMVPSMEINAYYNLKRYIFKVQSLSLSLYPSPLWNLFEYNFIYDIETFYYILAKDPLVIH